VKLYLALASFLVSLSAVESLKFHTDFPDEDDPYINNNLDKPVVGIITEPNPENPPSGIDNQNNSTISYSYVNWLQDLGINSLPLYWNYSDEELNYIIPRINGILLQGGDRTFVKGGLLEAQWWKIVQIAKVNNIPVWFICQGFEYLHFELANQDSSVLTNTTAWKIALPLTETEHTRDSAMFKYFSARDFDRLSDENKPSTINYHRLGVTVEDFMKYPLLRDTLKITSLGKDRDGKEFIGSVESKDFSESKFFAVQFHAEKANYNVHEDFRDEVQNINIIIVSQRLGLGYAEEVKKSHKINKMSEEDQEKYGVFCVITRAVTKGSNKYRFYKHEFVK